MKSLSLRSFQQRVKPNLGWEETFEAPDGHFGSWMWPLKSLSMLLGSSNATILKIGSEFLGPMKDIVYIEHICQFPYMKWQGAKYTNIYLCGMILQEM